MTGLLDKLKPFVRHLVIAATPLVAVAVLHYAPILQLRYAGNAAVSLLITAAVLYFTPLTAQYGRGARKARKG